jgi:hypothetical protein
MREDFEVRSIRRDGPATSPASGVEDLIAEPGRDDAGSRGTWANWEWRVWGAGHRARAAVRRAWQSLLAHEGTRP